MSPIVLPLPGSSDRPEAGPSRPARLRQPAFGQETSPEEVDVELDHVVQSVKRSKRVVVICGAGVSTAANIPDFRSAAGMYSCTSTTSDPGSPLSDDTCTPPIHSKARRKAPGVRELFHVNALLSPDLRPAQNALLSSLHDLAVSAEPTSFHRYIARLSREGRLLRCYTQNVDGLEEKAGLHVGIPEKEVRLSKRQKLLHNDSSPVDDPTLPLLPRVIPLHGLLANLRCTLCSHYAPFTSYAPLPPTLISCPECSVSSSIRAALSERSRRTGFLRPAIVLYGEEHRQAHLIGDVVERDLKGTARAGRGEKDEHGKTLKEGKADCLLVLGTSLAIPGIKRMVKEFAKSIRGTGRRGSGKVIFVNQESPTKSQEWEDVFDYWVRGDIQQFVTDYLDTHHLPADHLTPAETPRVKRKYTRKQSQPESRIDQTDPVLTPTSLTRSCHSSQYASPTSTIDSSDIETPTKAVIFSQGYSRFTSGQQGSRSAHTSLPVSPSKLTNRGKAGIKRNRSRLDSHGDASEIESPTRNKISGHLEKWEDTMRETSLTPLSDA